MTIVRMLGAGVLAVGVAVGGVGCGSSDIAKNLTAKPDLPDLSDGMILKESAFPAVTGGEYKATAPRKQDPMPEAEPCSPNSLIREGGQEAGSRVVGASPRYVVELFHTGTTHDVHEWAGRCLPMNEKDSTKKLADLPGLPASAISIVADDGGNPETYIALGFVRGVFVAASVDSGGKGLPAGAKSEVVKLFNNQAELLNSY